jgi:hypothetical protein
MRYCRRGLPQRTPGLRFNPVELLGNGHFKRVNRREAEKVKIAFVIEAPVRSNSGLVRWMEADKHVSVCAQNL